MKVIYRKNIENEIVINNVEYAGVVFLDDRLEEPFMKFPTSKQPQVKIVKKDHVLQCGEDYKYTCKVISLVTGKIKCIPTTTIVYKAAAHLIIEKE